MPEIRQTKQLKILQLHWLKRVRQHGKVHIWLSYLLAITGLILFPRTTPAQETANRIFLPIILKPESYATPAGEWPQLQGNPQRTGYAAETLGTNFQVTWTYPFQPEKVYPQVQAIVYEGHIFVGTEMGNLHAIDISSGNRSWIFNAGTPILNSVAAVNGKVFFGAMDGAVYAVNARDGTLAWKTQLSQRLGFSTAPVFAQNKIMLGGRNGIFYALDPGNGSIIWQYSVGSPILQTAAWDNGRVFFGAMNMRVYALDSSNGNLAWQSNKIPGMAFKDYWPVAYQGKVYIIPMGRKALGVTDGTQVTNAAAQQAVLADYAAHPNNFEKSMVVLDEATGQEDPAVIYYPYQTMHGAPSPPCIDRDGYFVVPAPSPTGAFADGWGRLDPNSRILVDVLNDGTNAGYGNGDETFNVSCADNFIFTMQVQEGNAHYTGAFNLDTRRWTHISAGHTNSQMSTNTQSAGGNPATIAGGMIYHISFHELIARSTQ